MRPHRGRAPKSGPSEPGRPTSEERAQRRTEERVFEPGPDDANRRFDRVARRLLPLLPLGRVYEGIRTGDIRIEGKRAEGSYRIEPTDRIVVRVALLGSEAAAGGDARAASRRLSTAVLLDNEHLLAVNKPRGVLVHAGDRRTERAGETLDELVRSALEGRLPPSLSFRPGPLHRLDRNTSGLVLFGKSAAGARRFAELLASGAVVKEYLALLEGEIEDEREWVDLLVRDRDRRITVPPDGRGAPREARSRVRPLAVAGGRSLCLVRIATGRTHQIRAQAAIHGHPLAGDLKYGARALWTGAGRGAYLLHAWRMVLPALDGLLGFRSLLAPLPGEATELLRRWLGPAGLQRAIDGALEREPPGGSPST